MTGPQPGGNPTVPILEFDPDTAALIEPGHVAAPLEGLPRAAVICFFADVVDSFPEGTLRECGRGVVLEALEELARSGALTSSSRPA